MKITRTRALLGAALATTLVWAGWPSANDAPAPVPSRKDRAAHAARSAAAPVEAQRKEDRESGSSLPNPLMAQAFAGQPPAPPAPQPQPQPEAPRAARDPQTALAALDTGLIANRVSTEPPVGNAFASRSWLVPPPPPPPAPAPPPPAPPPPPQAPALPFKYMGRMEESATRAIWYLSQGEHLVVVATGDVIDATYKVEGFANGQLRFRYLPLDVQQTLAIGDSP
jgi:hypothetical protein